MTTRRDFLTVTAGAVAGALTPRWAGAAPKAMSVVRESSFIKPFDDYFAKTLLPEYEKLTGIKMTYEATSVGGMLTRLTTIAETKSGPEIGMLGLNQAYLFDNSLVDVTDVANDIGKQLGGWHETVLIDSSETAKAVDFCRKFYQETMFEDVLGSTDVNNNKAFFGEQISCTNNASSILVVGKRDFPEMAKVTDHALNPAGPKGRFHLLNPVSHAVLTHA